MTTRTMTKVRELTDRQVAALLSSYDKIEGDLIAHTATTATFVGHPQAVANAVTNAANRVAGTVSARDARPLRGVVRKLQNRGPWLAVFEGDVIEAEDDEGDVFTAEPAPHEASVGVRERGRPPIGPRVNISIPRQILDKVEADAKERETRQTEIIRERLEAAYRFADVDEVQHRLDAIDRVFGGSGSKVTNADRAMYLVHALSPLDCAFCGGTGNHSFAGLCDEAHE